MSRSKPNPRRPDQPARRGFAASGAQRAKVAIEGAACRACFRGPSDPAHVIDRSLGGCDHADCVIPLCREHHRAYDAGELDVLPLLSKFEQAHAVLHVGIERARWRTTNERAA